MTNPPCRSSSVRLMMILFAAAGLVGCTSRSPEKQSQGTALGANAADLQEIGRVHREYVAAHNDSDVDRLMTLWSADAVLMAMDEPALTGHPAIREHYEHFFDESPSVIALSPVETRVAGDWAFERLQMIVSLPGGEQKTRHADIKYLWILERQPGGGWKIARVIYNLDGNIDQGEETGV